MIKQTLQPLAPSGGKEWRHRKSQVESQLIPPRKGKLRSKADKSLSCLFYLISEQF